MSQASGRRLLNVSRTPLDVLARRDDLGEQVNYVEECVGRSGTSISGYNGAGGGVDTSAVDVELPHG